MKRTDSTRLLRVEHDLALGVDLLAAEGPQQRIGEGRRVAEGVAERLADRALCRLQLLADLVVLLPGLRETSWRRLPRTTTCGRRSAPVTMDHGTDTHLPPTVVQLRAGQLVDTALRLADFARRRR